MVKENFDFPPTNSIMKRAYSFIANRKTNVREKYGNYGYDSPNLNHMNEKRGAYQCFSPKDSHGNYGKEENDNDFLNKISFDRVEMYDVHDKPCAWKSFNIDNLYQ